MRKKPNAGIYLLRDPVLDVVAYVGETFDFDKRFREYAECRRISPLVYLWICELHKHGMRPIKQKWVATPWDSHAARRELETRIIKQFAQRGEAVLNISKRGGIPQDPGMVRALLGSHFKPSNGFAL